MVIFVKENNITSKNGEFLIDSARKTKRTGTKTKTTEISNNQKQYVSGFTGTISNFAETQDKKNLPLPVILDENIEQSIEECERYNKLMWANYSKNLRVDENGVVYKLSKFLWWQREVRLDADELEVYNKHGKDFENADYKLENFKDQCKFYSVLIDEFIEKHHLRPPERKRAASIFFYILMGLAIVFLGFCIFAPELLISWAYMLGIATVIAQKIIVASHVLAPVIALIFFELARYISWKQNDYKENTNPELYSEYKEELKRHKSDCVSLTGERCQIGGYEHNNDITEAKKCPLYNYYHDEKDNLKKNMKTPLELLLKLKKAYEIPKKFRNTESKPFGRTEDENNFFYNF